jgi:hypothetical protein
MYTLLAETYHKKDLKTRKTHHKKDIYASFKQTTMISLFRLQGRFKEDSKWKNVSNTRYKKLKINRMKRKIKIYAGMKGENKPVT